MHADSQTRHTQCSMRGFTVLELAIVVTIIGLVLAMAASSGIAVLSTAKQSATIKKMAAIHDAILSFRMTNDRLPCPGNLTNVQTDNVNGVGVYGLEAGAVSATPISGTCNGGAPTVNYRQVATTSTTSPGVYEAEGSVPTATLGLPNDYMFDGWGNHIRYAVDATLTVPGAFKYFPLGAKCGPITINDALGAARTTTAVYALVSHGSNGHGAYTNNGQAFNASSNSVNELTNCRCSTSGAYNSSYTPALTFIQKEAQYDSGHGPGTSNYQTYYFDDIVSYKERSQLAAPWDKAGTVCPRVYVTDSGSNYVIVLDVNGNVLFSFGGSGTGNTQFNTPIGIDIDSKGNVVVADLNNNRVTKFDPLGNFILGIGAGYQGVTGSVGSSGALSGQFNKAVSVAVDGMDNIWAADQGNIRIQKFGSNGAYSSSFGSSGTANSNSGNFGAAVLALSFDNKNGFLWVGDRGNNRLMKFNPITSPPTFLLSAGGPSPYVCVSQPNTAIPACPAGNANAQFSGIRSVEVDSKGTIWVADDTNTRILKYDSNGVPQTIGTSLLNYFSSGTGPYTATVDVAGKIWVADYSANIVRTYDSVGNLLFSTATTFNSPAGLAISR